MPIKILMPSLSPTMESGTLLKWLKAEGDEVFSGDLLAEIETDKATMEIEAVDEGILGTIFVQDGTENVPVNKVIAILLEEGEDKNLRLPKSNDHLGNFKDFKGADIHANEERKNENKLPLTDVVQKSDKRMLCSPLARRIAKTNNIDLASITGTGPGGRIIKSDIEGLIKTTKNSADGPILPLYDLTANDELKHKNQSNDRINVSTSSPYKKIALSSIRKVVSERLTASSKEIPHFNLTADVKVNKLLDVSVEINSSFKDENKKKITLNDMIIKAVAIALTQNPRCNVCFVNESILQFSEIDISIAVALNEGLITPIIRNAYNKSLSAIANESNELINKARTGNLKLEEYQGGTFTISNLGMYGVKSFNSIINEPQGAILSIGAYEQRPIVEEETVKIAQVMSINLAVDHRCIDGEPAAKLLSDLKVILEKPSFLML